MKNKCKSSSLLNRSPDGAAFLSSIRFHQSFLLPANASHGRPSPLRVSYCDLDYRESKAPDQETGDTGPTLLYLPGAGERRYYGALWADALARKHRMRYLHPDRFGLGGTEEVRLRHRVECFTDLVEELLKHLGIEHVALASHSAGAIYTFNTILRLRHILHPERPFICFMTPWVLPKHSRALASSAARLVPSALLRRAHLIDQGIPLKVKWFLHDAYSGIERLTSRIKHRGEHFQIRSLRERTSCHEDGESRKAPDEDAFSDDARISSEWETMLCERDGDEDLSSEAPTEEDFGDEVAEEVEEPGCHQYSGKFVDAELYLECMFAENNTGVGDDLMLCLKRGGASSWGLFTDYKEAIEMLRSQETKLLALESEDQKKSKLRVETFFASQDSLIGDRGAAWFESLWMGEEGWVDYHSESIEGLGHDDIPSRQSGCLDWVFKEVAQSWRANGNAGTEEEAS